HRLSATLPEVHIGYAYLGEQHEFLARLVKVAESGVHRLVLVPLEEEPRLHETLLDLVQRSGISETNLEVVYAPAQALTVTSRSRRLERLRLLQASQAVSVPQISAEDENKLVDAIGQSLEQATALSNI
ncbi:MAG: hypothetical protein LLG44_10550, partial [Chloroflexi bacterium]|nr:hypothetical protein [Chloroflexota bacterium]